MNTKRYAVVYGRHKNITQAELALVWAHDIVMHRERAHFLCTYPERLDQLASTIKWWIVVPKNELTKYIDPWHIVWVSDKTTGVWTKKILDIKRFKEVEPQKTDKEIVAAQQEIHHLQGDQYVCIQGWQDIPRFTALDIEKPVRGMEVGMMPAKLTQMLINIGVGQHAKHTSERTLEGKHDTPITIYDPFCGFGTTCYIANSLWYKTIWSDITITPAKENLKRWKTTERYQELPITLFKHDSQEVVQKPFIEQVDLIVTEWWLWPVMHRRLQKADIQQRAESIITLWSNRLKASHQRIGNIPIVCSLPSYQIDGRETYVPQHIVHHAQSLWYTYTPVELYKRPRQLVARQIAMFA